MSDIIDELQSKVRLLEERVEQLASRTIDDPFLNKTFKAVNVMTQPHAPRALNGVYKAVVVGTKDPLKLGRIQFYLPLLHDWDEIEQEQFPWAMPINPFGGLDDQGTVFTPPAGSVVIIAFEDGDRDRPYYIGTVPGIKRSDTLQIKEETDRWNGSPGDRGDPHLVGDPNQIMPPWNNESYDGGDDYIDSGLEDKTQFSNEIPHIFGLKTPEKHFLQFVDGASTKNLRGKRVVLKSSKGHLLLFKDDASTTSEDIYSNQWWDDSVDNYPGPLSDKKPFNDHVVELEQTGIHLQSFGGHRLILDDKLDQAPEDNTWNAEWDPAQTSIKSKILFESITEHAILINDEEEGVGASANRSAKNGIFIRSATGNLISLCDHTTDQVGGTSRGIRIESTSGHGIELVDTGTSLASPKKRAGDNINEPQQQPDADKAYLMIHTGWGQYLLFNDASSQTEESSQYLQLANSPGKSSPESAAEDSESADPTADYNFLRMEQSESNHKVVMLRCAGMRLTFVEEDYLRETKNNEVLTSLNGSRVEMATNGYIIEITKAKYTRAYEYIAMVAGPKSADEDPDSGDSDLGLYPVLVARGPWICPWTKQLHWTDKAISRRVFATWGDESHDPGGFNA